MRAAGDRPRLLIANLNSEVELAGAHLPAHPGDPLYGLSRGARRSAAVLGSLLRVFARPGDVLWLVSGEEELGWRGEEMPEVAGVGGVRLMGGPLEAVEGEFGAVLAWQETPRVAALRRRVVRGRDDKNSSGGEGGQGGSGAVPRMEGGLPLWEAAWTWPVAEPAVVARVHHRRFALEVARDAGLALEGAEWVRSMVEVEAHAAAVDGAWVVKAPWSTAGRDRFVHGGGELAGADRRRVEGLLERFGGGEWGGLLFEPWLERVADFGGLGVVGEAGSVPWGWHRLEVDAHGGFRGIVIPGEEEVEFGGVLEDGLRTVGAALHGAGYRGPFGVDGFSYRGGDGEVRLRPLVEINARWTFGWLARAWAGRLREAEAVPAGRGVRLVVGSAGLGDGEEGWRLVPGGGAALTLDPSSSAVNVPQCRGAPPPGRSTDR